MRTRYADLMDEAMEGEGRAPFEYSSATDYMAACWLFQSAQAAIAHDIEASDALNAIIVSRYPGFDVADVKDDVHGSLMEALSMGIFVHFVLLHDRIFPDREGRLALYRLIAEETGEVLADTPDVAHHAGWIRITENVGSYISRAGLRSGLEWLASEIERMINQPLTEQDESGEYRI